MALCHSTTVSLLFNARNHTPVSSPIFPYSESPSIPLDTYMHTYMQLMLHVSLYLSSELLTHTYQLLKLDAL